MYMGIKQWTWFSRSHILHVLITQNTLESLKFVVAQFSWYLWVTIPHVFTSSTKMTYWNSKPTHPRNYIVMNIQNPTMYETGPPMNLNDSTDDTRPKNKNNLNVDFYRETPVTKNILKTPIVRVSLWSCQFLSLLY